MKIVIGHNIDSVLWGFRSRFRTYKENGAGWGHLQAHLGVRAPVSKRSPFTLQLLLVSSNFLRAYIERNSFAHHIRSPAIFGGKPAGKDHGADDNRWLLHSCAGQWNPSSTNPGNECANRSWTCAAAATYWQVLTILHVLAIFFFVCLFPARYWSGSRCYSSWD